jgi:small subunit ribosomal protein S16
MLAIRMRREGAKKRPFFRLVVTEARTPRDGKFIESLGTYDPTRTPESVEVDRARLAHWIASGARPSDTVRTIVARHQLGEVPVAAPEPVAVGQPAAVPEPPAEPEQTTS